MNIVIRFFYKDKMIKETDNSKAVIPQKDWLITIQKEEYEVCNILYSNDDAVVNVTLV